MNNKGFTLVEVLGTIAILALVLGVALPNVISTVTTSKEKSLNILKNNIKTAAINLYQEVDNGITIYNYSYNNNGSISKQSKISIDSNSASFNLQALVSNSYLRGTSNAQNQKVLTNPKDDKNIGNCNITIIKSVNNGKVSYTITNNSADSSCPTGY